jgi:NADH:ubiquinone oxidoreductase subunit 2 (subunit N)
MKSLVAGGRHAYWILALCVLIACWLLFSLDEDTHGVENLFEPGNLIALLIYFTPTFLLSVLSYRYFAKKGSMAGGIAKALVVAVPLGFAVIIIALNLMLHRRG